MTRRGGPEPAKDLFSLEELEEYGSLPHLLANLRVAAPWNIKDEAQYGVKTIQVRRVAV